MLSCQSRYFYQLWTWAFSFVRKRETPGMSYGSIHSERGVMPMPVIDCNAFSMKRPSVRHLFSWINNPFFNEEHMESYFSTWIRKLFFFAWGASLKCFFLLGSVDFFCNLRGGIVFLLVVHTQSRHFSSWIGWTFFGWVHMKSMIVNNVIYTRVPNRCRVHLMLFRWTGRQLF